MAKGGVKAIHLIVIGFILVILGLIFSFLLVREFEYDRQIRSQGRMGFFQFIQEEKANTTMNRKRISTCQYKVVDRETQEIQIRAGECRLNEDRQIFEAKFLPQEAGFRLTRFSSLWFRTVILIVGLPFLLGLISFIVQMWAFNKTKSRSLPLKN